MSEHIHGPDCTKVPRSEIIETYLATVGEIFLTTAETIDFDEAMPIRDDETLNARLLVLQTLIDRAVVFSAFGIITDTSLVDALMDIAAKTYHDAVENGIRKEEDWPAGPPPGYADWLERNTNA